MNMRTIGLALCAAGLLGSASAGVAAETMTAQPRDGIAGNRGLAMPVRFTPNDPASARLAESCDDNWWEFSLIQAITCALKDNGDDSEKPEFLDDDVWESTRP